MQRQARAQFQVVRISRWSLALVLLLALAMVYFPLSRVIPVASLQPQRVRPGVTLLGLDLSGRSSNEVRQTLQRLAVRLHGNPVSASEARRFETTLVIPEVNGYRLDVNRTLLRVMAAPPGDKVLPATITVQPDRTLANFPLRAIYQGNPAKPQVALLINVAWGEEYLPKILTALDRQGVKATFFFTGLWAEKYPNLVKSVAAAGHELASHGYTDRVGPFDLQRQGQLKADIQKGAEVIYKITGRKPLYYSPHKGEVNEQLVGTAAELGMKTIMWSLDTLDWQDPSAESILQSVTSKAKNGDLVLMHPRQNTATILERLIAELKSRGLKPVTLSEMLRPDPTLPGSVTLEPLAALRA